MHCQLIIHVRVCDWRFSNNKIEHHTQVNNTSSSAMKERPRDASISTVIAFEGGGTL